MQALSFDYSKTKPFVAEHEIRSIIPQVMAAREMLLSGKGLGSDFLGWVDLPEKIDKMDLDRIKLSAKKIQEQSDILIVIGIGGSYLGARAAIEFLQHQFYNQISKEKRGGVEVYFAGNNVSGTYIQDLIDVIGDRDFSVNVISKSGTTTEPAIAFRVFKSLLEKKYGYEGAANRIYATTDAEKGALKQLSDAEGYETFVIPDNVGGRFSVLTPVGLLPIAAAGCDIDALIQGARDMRIKAVEADFEQNPSLQYAALRNLFLRKGFSIEILANYEPALHMTGEWWKQLFGESEGKDHKGLFPAAYDLSTDLHSLGQFVQDGSRILFETVLQIQTPSRKLILEKTDDDLDGLNYLAEKDMNFVAESAMQGTALAHTDGGTPNLMITLPERDAYALGQLFYFFEFACGISGYLLGVNPFDQPGVENYKRNMFALLGKPGYETERDVLISRLSI